MVWCNFVAFCELLCKVECFSALSPDDPGGYPGSFKENFRAKATDLKVFRQGLSGYVYVLINAVGTRKLEMQGGFYNHVTASTVG